MGLPATCLSPRCWTLPPELRAAALVDAAGIAASGSGVLRVSRRRPGVGFQGALLRIEATTARPLRGHGRERAGTSSWRTSTLATIEVRVRDRHHRNAGSFRDMAERIRLCPAESRRCCSCVVAILNSHRRGGSRHPPSRKSMKCISTRSPDWDRLSTKSLPAASRRSSNRRKLTVFRCRAYGLIATRHGLLPVPAPAIASILIGIRRMGADDGIGGERVTPTAR